MSLSTVYESFVRLREARLVSSTESGSEVARGKFLDLLVHAVPTIFFPRKTGIARGILTGASAPVFGDEFSNLGRRPSGVFVWPYAHGKDSGEGLVPIYPSVPVACARNRALYDLMSAIEVLRTGQWQEKNIAMTYLEKVLETRRVRKHAKKFEGLRPEGFQPETLRPETLRPESLQPKNSNAENLQSDGIPVSSASEADTKIEGTRSKKE